MRRYVDFFTEIDDFGPYPGPLSGKPVDCAGEYSEFGPDKVVLDRGVGFEYLDSLVSVSALEAEASKVFGVRSLIKIESPFAVRSVGVGCGKGD